jgi:hypothetical protein
MTGTVALEIIPEVELGLLVVFLQHFVWDAVQFTRFPVEEVV